MLDQCLWAKSTVRCQVNWKRVVPVLRSSRGLWQTQGEGKRSKRCTGDAPSTSQGLDGIEMEGVAYDTVGCICVSAEGERCRPIRFGKGMSKHMCGVLNVAHVDPLWGGCAWWWSRHVMCVSLEGVEHPTNVSESGRDTVYCAGIPGDMTSL